MGRAQAPRLIREIQGSQMGRAHYGCKENDHDDGEDPGDEEKPDAPAPPPAPMRIIEYWRMRLIVCHRDLLLALGRSYRQILLRSSIEKADSDCDSNCEKRCIPC